jgi:fructose-bisphosphate aldolase class II
VKKYGVSGAQHGTSGNNYERLRGVAQRTNTTKANVATALQMVSWGVKVNEYGNAELDDKGRFIKLASWGVPPELWEAMVSYADKQGWKGGDYKKLNRPFENKLLGLPTEVRENMVQNVEEFVYNLLVNVFNAADTAPRAVEAILKAGSFDLGPKSERLEDPSDWTEEKIRQKAAELPEDKGPGGDFED